MSKFYSYWENEGSKFANEVVSDVSDTLDSGSVKKILLLLLKNLGLLIIQTPLWIAGGIWIMVNSDMRRTYRSYTALDDKLCLIGYAGNVLGVWILTGEDLQDICEFYNGYYSVFLDL